MADDRKQRDEVEKKDRGGGRDEFNSEDKRRNFDITDRVPPPDEDDSKKRRD